MKIEILNSPTPELVKFLDKKIEEFNLARWEVKEKKPLCIKVQNDKGEVVAGAAAKTFGLWLLIETLWVSEDLRGQKAGSKILSSLESEAKARGCKYVLLDTLNFQARPFYEKMGYKVEWVQNQYPKDGAKYFMTKVLA